MKTIFCTLLFSAPALLFAQRSVSIRPQRPATEAVVAPLFRLDPRAANHSLTAYLPGNAVLTIESQGVSYWPARTELSRIAALGAGAASGVADSFRSATSEKSVALHLPVDETVQTVQYTENTDAANLVLRSGGAQAALKAGFDTVRIMKTYGVKKTKKDTARLQQIQYTFVVKSLRDFEDIAANEALLDDVARTMDSVVAVRRKRWGRDDAWYHSIEAVYRPGMGRGEKQRLVAQRGYDEKGNRGILKGLEGGGSFGATLLRNTLTPSVDFGFGYRWPTRNLDEYRFVRLSQTSLIQFRQQSAQSYRTHSTAFLNFEFGKVYNQPRTLLPLYRTAFGLGWAYAAGSFGGDSLTVTEPPLKQGTLRFYFAYSASKAISILPEIFIGGNTNGFLPAVTVRLNL